MHDTPKNIKRKPVKVRPGTGKARTSTPPAPMVPHGETDRGMVQNALLLGIDLGTSRSSIVSMNGPRKVIESYVGWPKDSISRKHLKADILFGQAALDNRLALNLYRPLEKGVIKGTHDNDNGNSVDEQSKNFEAAAELVRYLVSLVSPGRDDVLFGVVGVPAQASDRNKQGIIDATCGVLDSVMIVSEPFAVAYGLERINDVLVIDIGAGTTDLCRMHGTVPSAEDQVSFEIAGDAIDQALFDLITKHYPEAQLTVNMCKLFKEQYGFVSEQTEKIEVSLPVDGKPIMHDITADLKTACSIIIEPILEAIHRLVATHNPEFQEVLRHNVILSGGGALLNGLNKQIEDGLAELGGGEVTVAVEPLYAGANGALQLAVDMPAEYWQQLA
jgi:rod shape-determining protein MreB